GVDGHGRLAGTVGHGVDVTARPAAGKPQPHPHRVGVSADREAAFVELTLHADETDARAVVVVKPGSLARHPREHPDVDPLVLVQKLVASPLAVGDDERPPEIRAIADSPDELDELVDTQRPRLVEQLRRPGGELLRERRHFDWLQSLFDHLEDVGVPSRGSLTWRKTCGFGDTNLVPNPRS